MLKYYRHLLAILILFALFGLLFPKIAYAYLDPGAGSYMLQLIIGVLVGGLYAIKLSWKKIIIFFKNLFSKKKKAT